VRDAAAEALQSLGGRRACALLEPVLVDHPDANVRAAAARALSSGTFPPSGYEIECASILLCALTDGDPDVRAAAAFGIGNTARDRRRRRFVPGLLRALDDPAAQVRAGACYALAYLGSEAELPALEQRLDDRAVPDGYVTDYSVEYFAGFAIRCIAWDAGRRRSKQGRDRYARSHPGWKPEPDEIAREEAELKALEAEMTALGLLFEEP
jgi:hypothetical protein